jgi:hypothetical protein
MPVADPLGQSEISHRIASCFERSWQEIADLGRKVEQFLANHAYMAAINCRSALHFVNGTMLAVALQTRD